MLFVLLLQRDIVLDFNVVLRLTGGTPLRGGHVDSRLNRRPSLEDGLSMLEVKTFVVGDFPGTSSVRRPA
ncbi:hypothetical protein FB566_4376 [Stackebrandtia endophytica]|uniref:Uncharacterized protein n=1 Tax=Stackebrandtia endophytica TaxID=1496996 RepID=A0A543B1S6_9ACTN|nr:hypothetical protein [Stackebrandtia endophytica]TQL78782.1 hypothetical protein FB566_4376 [Stackebrandtia endophytica]